MEFITQEESGLTYLSSANFRKMDGDERIRTADIRLAKALLYQLSYIPR